eukprot:COSAG06_NODE_177_length_21031_cov_13.839528_8_plen_174_part_00
MCTESCGVVEMTSLNADQIGSPLDTHMYHRLSTHRTQPSPPVGALSESDTGDSTKLQMTMVDDRRPRRALGTWVGAFPTVWCGFLLAPRHHENTGHHARSRKPPRRFWRHVVSIAHHEFELRRWSHSFPLVVNRCMMDRLDMGCHAARPAEPSHAHGVGRHPSVHGFCQATRR